MKKVVWKFPLETQPFTEMVMPKDAEILSVQSQFNEAMMWALVDPDSEKEIRRFAVVETGHEIPDLILKLIKKYIGTYQLNDGNYVLHVFELADQRAEP